MLLYKVVIATTGHFATPFKGDTLFGQFCWSYRESFGEARLENDVLKGYTEHKPKIIFSDAYYHGFLNLPKFPYDLQFEANYDASLRKQIKARKYISQSIIFSAGVSLKKIWHDTVSNKEFAALNASNSEVPDLVNFEQTHNTINRNLGSTSSEIFAPFSVRNHTYRKPKTDLTKLDIFIMLDEDFIKECCIDEISKLISNIGLHGYGADASIGKGKFDVISFSQVELSNKTARSGITLAPSITSEIDNVAEIYYDTITRFGRHGNIMAHSKKVFKKPITLMNSNAFVVFKDQVPQYIGNGFINSPKLAGDDHDGYVQAYSMIIPLNIE